MKMQIDFPFTLPRGYVDSEGTVHREGMMRLATAYDDTAPMKDPRVQTSGISGGDSAFEGHHQSGRCDTHQPQGDRGIVFGGPCVSPGFLDAHR